MFKAIEGHVRKYCHVETRPAVVAHQQSTSIASAMPGIIHTEIQNCNICSP